MSLEILVEAEDLDSAIKIAAERLSCSPTSVRYKVLQSSSSGFFGLGSRKSRIMAWQYDAVSKHIDQALKMVQDLDGHFRVELSGCDLCLSVFPPAGSGRSVDENTVYAELMEYEPASLDESELARIVSAAEARPCLVGVLAKAGERDGGYEIHISEDAMVAHVTLIPPKKGGRDVTLAEIGSGLIQKGVVFGIDRTGIESALLNRKYNVSISIAHGSKPVQGAPGRLEFHFRTDKHVVSFKEDESGRVNYREIDLIEDVAAGDVLVTRIAPDPGIDGSDVTGRKIVPRPGKEAQLPRGKNVIATGDELKAGIGGHVVYVGGKVIVSPVYHVKGDVNYSTGNIDFEGTVRVDGLIEDNFSVKARGSVFVKKSIGKCTIDVGGNLVVIGGILGRDEANIHASGDIVALFIEHSRVVAGRDLIVGELILHSDVTVGRDLAMNGTRASFVGGMATAGGNITLRTIGGEGTTRTHIRAGIKPDLLQTLNEIRTDSHEVEEKLAKISEALRIVDAKGGPNVAELEPKIALLKSSAVALKSRVKVLAEAYKNVMNAIVANSTRSQINVMDTAMEGTRIEIGNSSLVLTTPVQYATFKRAEGEIKILPYGEHSARPPAVDSDEDSSA